MLWKHFKKIIEAQGIDDNTEVIYIDTDMYKPKIRYVGNNEIYIG